MLNGIHFLLTYTCLFECDHCFLYSGPSASGTFSLAQIRQVLAEARKIPSVESIYFEGGEPFLYYPILLGGIRMARDLGFEVGVVTNAYYALADEDADLWLRPLAEMSVDDLSVSDDAFHYDEDGVTPPKRAMAAAKRLGIPSTSICIEKPKVEGAAEHDAHQGEPVIGGGALFKGRAVEKLAPGLPRRGWEQLLRCPHEDLESPSRVHVDCYGHVHICQGISIGNMWKTPLSELIARYDPAAHPICGPLVRGGPAELARAMSVPHEGDYVDECHLCYEVRRALIDRFPELLAPRQVYGLR